MAAIMQTKRDMRKIIREAGKQMNGYVNRGQPSCKQNAMQEGS
jgi:hypothetical protein